MQDAVNVVNLSPPVVTAHPKPAANAAPPPDGLSFDAVLNQASFRIRDQKDESREKSVEQDPNVQAAVHAANGKPQALNTTKKPEEAKKGEVEKEEPEKTTPETQDNVIQPEMLMAQAVIITPAVVEPIIQVEENSITTESDAATMVIDVTAKPAEPQTAQVVATTNFATETIKATTDEAGVSNTEIPVVDAKGSEQKAAQTLVEPTRKNDPLTAGASEVHRSEVATAKLEGKALEQASQVVATPQPVSTIENVPSSQKIEKSEIKVESRVESPPPETPPVADGVPINTANTTSQVHEPARLAEAPRNEVISQVSTQLGQMVKANQTSFRMQLYPEELGHIDLRIVSTKTGLAVSMVAESVTTQVALKSEMSHLKQTIEQAGIQISNLHIGHQQTSNGQHAFEGQSNAHKPVYHSTMPANVANAVNSKAVTLQESSIDFRA